MCGRCRPTHQGSCLARSVVRSTMRPSSSAASPTPHCSCLCRIVTVAWRDALIGGFIAAILAEIFKHSFGEFVSRGTTGSIYGAFAVLPLFLIWIYLSWYVVLFGAAITATFCYGCARRVSQTNCSPAISSSRRWLC